MTESQIQTSADVNYETLLGTHNAQPSELLMYQKKLTWRAGNLGMKELDLAVGVYAKRYLRSFPVDECQRFESEILKMNTPDLWKMVLKMEDEAELAELIPATHYIHSIRTMLQEQDWAHP
jgi:succinate dehydrogenase flavin-adding protein (antitoxin of CptAB toxin-antitoxin module)